MGMRGTLQWNDCQYSEMVLILAAASSDRNRVCTKWLIDFYKHVLLTAASRPVKF